jgi:hypothetical protein
MKRFFSSVKELILEKKFTILLLGGVIGLLSFFIVVIIEGLDLQAMESFYTLFPEDLMAFIGDLGVIANPYGFWDLSYLYG